MTEIFTIAPASARPLWILAAIAIFLISMLLLFTFFAYASRATRFELSSDGLSIRRTLYGRSLPWSSLIVEEASVVNMRQSPDHRPRTRTNGIGLPGYQAGWFRLRQGKALVFITDPARVVALPTREGFTLMLSVRDPEAFVRAVRLRAVSGQM